MKFPRVKTPKHYLQLLQNNGITFKHTKSKHSAMVIEQIQFLPIFTPFSSFSFVCFCKKLCTVISYPFTCSNERESSHVALRALKINVEELS